MNCSLGIERIVEKTLNNRPWFKYTKGDKYVHIGDSPNGRININTYYGAAQTTANSINKQINEGYKNIGDVAYPVFLDNKGVIQIAPSKKQLQLIESQDDAEIAELEQEIALEQEKLELSKTIEEADTFVNKEGDVISKQDILESKKNLKDLSTSTQSEVFGVTKESVEGDKEYYDYSNEIKSVLFNGESKNSTAKEILQNIISSSVYPKDSYMFKLIDKLS